MEQISFVYQDTDILSFPWKNSFPVPTVAYLLVPVRFPARRQRSRGKRTNRRKGLRDTRAGIARRGRSRVLAFSVSSSVCRVDVISRDTPTTTDVGDPSRSSRWPAAIFIPMTYPCPRTDSQFERRNLVHHDRVARWPTIGPGRAESRRKAECRDGARSTESRSALVRHRALGKLQQPSDILPPPTRRPPPPPPSTTTTVRSTTIAKTADHHHREDA